MGQIQLLCNKVCWPNMSRFIERLHKSKIKSSHLELGPPVILPKQVDCFFQEPVKELPLWKNVSYLN